MTFLLSWRLSCSVFLKNLTIEKEDNKIIVKSVFNITVDFARNDAFQNKWKEKNEFHSALMSYFWIRNFTIFKQQLKIIFFNYW